MHKFIAVQRYEVVCSVLFKCGACPSGQVQHCASASASTLAGAPALDLAITSGGRHHCYFHGSSSSLSSSSTLIQHFVNILSRFCQHFFCQLYFVAIFRSIGGLFWILGIGRISSTLSTLKHFFWSSELSPNDEIITCSQSDSFQCSEAPTIHHEHCNPLSSLTPWK